jgi:hypothetical protein
VTQAQVWAWGDLKIVERQLLEAVKAGRVVRSESGKLYMSYTGHRQVGRSSVRHKAPCQTLFDVLAGRGLVAEVEGRGQLTELGTACYATKPE